MATKWEIEAELKRDADNFISHEMHLSRYNEYYDFFRDYWIQSAFPAFMPEVKLNYEAKLTEKSGRPIELASRPKSKEDKRIWKSVGWFADDASHQEIGMFLTKLQDWPISEKKAATHPGGRPKKEIDTVLCYILRKRVKMLEGEVGRKMDWTVKMTSYGTKCREVRKRVTQGKKLMQTYEF